MRDGGPTALIRLVVTELRKRKPALPILDGLFAARDHAEGRESDAAFRAFVHELGQQAGMTGTTILLLTDQSRASPPEYTMVDGWIELQDEMCAERALRTLIVHKQRGSAFLRGRHEYRIDSDGLNVFPRMETQASRKPVVGITDARLATGVDALDRMIGGGIPERSSSVVLGPTGSGKTTIAMQFLDESTPKERGLMFGFYETPDRLARKVVRRRVSILKIRDSDFDHISQQFEVTPTGIELCSVDGRERLADTTTSATVVASSNTSASGGRVR